MVEMTAKRQIDIYSAGCAICNDAVQLVEDIACSSCEITVKDMTDDSAASEAKGLGIKSVLAIVIDGRLTDCPKSNDSDRDALNEAGNFYSSSCTRLL